jgi:serine/threonine protein kinase/WD40 repeat protein
MVASLNASHIDASRDAFERAWRSGSTPTEIGDYLTEVSRECRSALLVELACIDLEYRWRSDSGLEPSDRWLVEEYLRRFPDDPFSEPLLQQMLSVEFRVRCSAGETPAIESYRERFPALFPDLERHLTQPDPYRTVIPDPHRTVIGETPAEMPHTGESTDGPSIRRVGQYEILSEIARGAFGVVYKARQIKVNRVVALKMMLAGQFADLEELERFRIEAEAAGQLDHPHIVPVFEAGEHDGHAFLSMGYVEGKSLRALLNDGPLSPGDAARMMAAICGAVQYAHERGIIHRDLKPANILVDSKNEPRVTDFGLAKRAASDVGMTMKGQVLGTPAFMPPEQASGRMDQVGPLADVYSLGATLYNVLTGRPPFLSSSVPETLRLVQRQEPVAPRQLSPGIPRDLETICLKAMQKDRLKRYASAAEFHDDLERFRNHEPIQARPVSKLERTWRWCQRNRARAALYAVSAVSAIVLFVGALYASAAIGRADADKNMAEERKKAAEDLADIEKLSGLVRHIGEHQRRGRAGWTRAVETDVLEANSLKNAPKQMAALRGGLADAVGAIDVDPRLARTLVAKYAAGAIAFHPSKQLVAVGLRRAPSQILPTQIRLIDITSGRTVRKLYTPGAFYDWVRATIDNVRNWDLLHTGNLKYSRGEGIEWLAFSPDGRWLVASTKFGRLMRWDLNDASPDAKAIDFPERAGGIERIAFRRDGRFFYATRGNLLRAWTVADWKPAASAELPGPIGSISPSVPGDTLVCAVNKQLHFFSDDLLAEVRKPLPIQPESFAFSPDGKTLLIVAQRQGRFLLPYAADDQSVGRLRPRDGDDVHDGDTTQALFSADGGLILTATEFNGQIRLWETLSGRQLSHLVVPGSFIRVEFAPDGRSFAVILDYEVRLYPILGVDTPTVRAVQHYAALSPQPISTFTITPDGKTVVTHSLGTGVTVAAEPGEEVLCAWPCDDAGIAEAQTSVLTVPRRIDNGFLAADTTGIIAFATNKDICFWRPPAFEAGKPLIDVVKGFKTAAIMPGARHLWVVESPLLNRYAIPEDAADPNRQTMKSRKSNPYLPELTIHARVGERINGLGNITSVAAHPQTLVVGWRGGMLRRYDPMSGDELSEARLSPSSEITQLAISINGQLVAAGSAFGELFLRRGEQQIAIKDQEANDERDRPHDDAVSGVLFLNDSYVVSAGSDSMIRFWGIEGDEAHSLFSLHFPRRVRQIALHPDGRRLMVLIDGERGLRVWHLDRLMRRLAERGLSERGPTLPGIKVPADNDRPRPAPGPAPGPSEAPLPEGDLLAKAPLRMQLFAHASQNRPLKVGWFNQLSANDSGLHDTALPDERFAARWTGWLRAPKPGTYQLELSSSGPAWLELDGVRVLTTENSAARRANVPFDDRPRAVRMALAGTFPKARVDIEWRTPDNPDLAPIASRHFFPTLDAAQAARFAEVQSLPSPVELKQLTTRSLSAVFTADGAKVLSGADDGHVRLHDAATGRIERDFDHDARVGGVAVSPDGSTAASGDNNGKIFLWDLRKENPFDEPLRVIKSPKWRILWLGFSPDDERLAVSYRKPDVIKLWSVATGEDGGELRRGGDLFDAGAWAPDGKTLFAADYSGPVVAFDIERNEIANLFAIPGGRTNGVALTPDGRQLVVCSKGFNGGVTVWDLATNRLAMTLEKSATPEKVAVSPDGRWIAATFDKAWKVWNAETGEEAWSHLERTDFYAVRFSPDSKRLLVTSEKRDNKPTVRIWTLLPD